MVLTASNSLLTRGPEPIRAKSWMKGYLQKKRGVGGKSKECTPKYYQVYTLNITQLMTQGEGPIIIRRQGVSFIASCHKDCWKLNKAASSCYCYQLASSHFHGRNNCHMPAVHFLWPLIPNTGGRSCRLRWADRPRAECPASQILFYKMKWFSASEYFR